MQSGGKAKRQVIGVGASDASYTQVTSGLAQGEHVALAQINATLPSSGTNRSLARLAGGGGFRTAAASAERVQGEAAGLQLSCRGREAERRPADPAKPHIPARLERVPQVTPA